MSKPKINPATVADKFMSAMTPNFVLQQDEVEGVIESVEFDTKSRTKSAKATIGGKTGRKVQISIGDPYQKGDKLAFKLVNGSLVNGIYEPTRRIESDNTNIAPNKSRPMPIIEITGASATTLPGSGGIVTLQKTESNSDPSGDIKARALIPYRTIVEGQYSLLDEGITEIAYRYRIQGETDFTTGQSVDWYQQQKTPIYPKEYVHVTITEPVTFDDLTLPIVIPSGMEDKVIYNQAVWWKVEREVIIGYINSSTPTVLNVLQRGVESTTAVAHGSLVTSPAQPTSMAVLLNGLLTLDNLRPSTQYANVIYEIQLAPVDAFNFQGEWSDTYSFTVWKKTDTPPAPTDFVVSITRDGYKLSWRKIPREDVRYYQVFRYTSNPTSLGVPDVTSAQTMPGAGTVGTYPGLIEGNQINWPVNQYTGNGYAAKYFCIRAIDNSGNPGTFTAWTTDTTPPPNPDPTNVTIQATAEGPKIIIAQGDTSDRDEGFSTWVLWQATTNTGAGKTVVSRFKDRQYTYRNDPAGLQYYQVTSEDLIGNNGSTTDNATYWKRDDGVPSAPAGLAVTAVQGGFRVKWTRPSFAQLENIDYLELQRTDNISSNVVKKIDKNTDSMFWPAMEVPILANVATYRYFAIQAVDYNGTASGYSATADDITPPANPSVANVRITAERGFVRVTVNNNENPQLDDSWKEYYVLRSTTGNTGSGTGVIKAAQFSGKSAQIYDDVYSNYYWQVVSADWVGNYAINTSGWIRAQVLYPVDTRLSFPANGDFQETDPTTTAEPLWWDFVTNGYTKGAATTERVFSAVAYAASGGINDTRCLEFTLGSNSNGATGNTLRSGPYIPYNPYDFWQGGIWVRIPRALVNPDIITIKVTCERAVNSDGTGGSDANITMTNFVYAVPAAGVFAGQWIYIETDPVVFVGPVVTVSYRYARISLVSFAVTRTVGSPTAMASSDVVAIDNLALTSYLRPNFS